MKITWRTEWPHWLVLAAQFALAGLTWSSMPDRMPIHWGLDGQVNGYGGKFEGLLALPIISLALYFLLLWLPRLDPGRANYQSFAGAYAVIRLGVLAVVTVAYGVIQLEAHGRGVRVEAVMPLALGALLFVIGGVLGKIRPNWLVGIRTPWTLSSKQAWNRTHRAGGWLFIVVGVLSMTLAILRADWAMQAMIGSLLTGALGLVVYSYFVWRADPEKIPPAGTLQAGNG